MDIQEQSIIVKTVGDTTVTYLMTVQNLQENAIATMGSGINSELLTLASKKKIVTAFLDGDRGGNQFKVRYGKVKNLHSLWDRGAGLFYKYYKNYPWQPWQIRDVARRFEHQYSMLQYLETKQDSEPDAWANESYQLAIIHVYDLVYDKKPSKSYIKKAQSLVQQRITIAGYRLAILLNQLFDREHQDS